MAKIRAKDWQCEIAGSVTGGDWGFYGYARWSSYCEWLVPGTLDLSKE